MWLVAGVGRVLPARMWEGVVDLAVTDDPWDSDFDIVPLDLVDAVIGPGGSQPVAELPFRIDCPIVPELFR